MGAAWMPGRLFRVEWYPGALYEPLGQGKVYGELYELSDPMMLLTQLDLYEGTGEAFRQPWEYIRVQVSVQADAASENSIVAWTYLYNHPVERLALLPSGNFRLPIQ